MKIAKEFPRGGPQTLLLRAKMNILALVYLKINFPAEIMLKILNNLSKICQPPPPPPQNQMVAP